MTRKVLLWGLVCVAGVVCISSGAVNSQSLGGSWRFALDRQDAGIEQAWFKRELSEATICLPGTLQEQGFGDAISTTTPWLGRLYDKNWYLRAEYKKYGQAGNIKVPFWLQPERHYVGTAWYQRTITIPAGWKGRRAVLTLERPHWSTTVWLDEKKIGYDDSLSAPHVYDLGVLEPGEYRLSVRVDNRMLQAIREDAHSITDSTQTNWNGMIGELTLASTTPVWLEDVRVFTDIEAKTARLEVTLGNVTGNAGQGMLTAGAVSVPVVWTVQGATAEVVVPLGDKAGLWDEFGPALHSLTLRLVGENPAEADDARAFSVGLRKIQTRDARFYLNDRLTFFRGTHEGCQFPLTGYPPMDMQSWRKIFTVCKAYGLNHMRFHSWCPPEAAFIAADEMGMYLQPECSNWGQYSSRDNQLVEWVNRETEKIVKAYGNHPSFVLFSTGNEPAGPWQEPLLKWCREWKAKDNRRVYASQTGRYFGERPGPVADIDYLIAIRIGSYMFRGDSSWHGRDFSGSLEGTNYPVISHETGQWCAYPDFSEISKYTGKLKPKNFEIFRESLTEKGMLDQAHDFLMASGTFQLACYKEEIEGLLRTKGMGGFQLLDLHDYLGQGTALVGVLNAFWESKGYVTPEVFRRFCNVTVPLARMRQSMYTTNETLAIEAEIAHFGAAPLERATPVWKIVGSDGKVAAEGRFEERTIPLGNGTMLGTVRAELALFKAPQQYRLVIGLEGTTVENDWPLWVYPATMETAVPEGVLVTRDFAEAARQLEQGGKVLFTPGYNELRWDCPPVGRLPIFWNRLMGPGWERFLGLLCEPKHPALAEFPTAFCYQWQWQDIVRPYCRAVNLDMLPGAVRPIVQVIDDWNRNYKLGLVFECRVGKGRLVVCSADIETDLEKRPAARQLRYSLLAYMAGEAFNPTVSVEAGQIEGVLFDNQIMRKLGAEATADEAERGSDASRAIDGNPNTYWLTAGRGRGKTYPHYLQVRFAEPVAMKGLIVMARQNHREHEGDIGEYVIESSSDGQAWEEVVAGRLESTFEPQEIAFGRTVKAQYVKLRALSGFGGDTAASLAELAVIYAGPGLEDKQVAPAVPYRAVRTATEEIDEGIAADLNTLPGKIASKPLYCDPVYDGAADPVLCWNRQEKKWFMLYTNRRANVPNLKGVSWVHGTPIGIAESTDGGATWSYRGTARIDYGQGEFSYWAPEVIYHEGVYHMYLSFVPGMHTDWAGTRDIIHLTSTDMLEWKYQSTLKLSSNRVIDACVLRMPDGTWRMWYNNETDRKSIYYADSPDLFTWKDGGKAISDQAGEGPKVFQWKDKYWMIVDVWDGQGVYSSDDAVTWMRQKENLLQKAGQGPDDRTKGLHADVVVSGDRAFLFYFTHPGRTADNAGKDGTEQRRSSIQVVELEHKDGRLVCDRDKPTRINLLAPVEEAVRDVSKDCNACDNGAIGDGKTVCTEAIQKTIDQCHSAGGGTVVFSPGVYKIGSLFLKDNVNLRVDEGVTLKGVQDDAAYPLVFTRVAGIEMEWPAALINAHHLKNVKIYGKGVIDGSGKPWWDRYWAMNRDYSAKGLRWIVDYDCKRPRLILIYKSSDVSVEGLTLKEPGFWTVHICFSDHITVDGVTIQANCEDQFGPSSDGIDIDSSTNILVQNCDIDCNDDNFCLKAGRDADGLRVNKPTENVVIRNCIARRGQGLITCGSETSGGIRNVEVYNLKAVGTKSGIRFKSTQGRGGTVCDINIHNIQMKDVAKVIDLNYDWYPAYNTVPDTVRKQIEAEGKPLPPHWIVLMQQVPEEQGTPYIHAITIGNLNATDCGTAFAVQGSEKQKAGTFVFENISIQAQKAGTIKNAENWIFKNVTIQAADETAIQLKNCNAMQGL